MSDQPKIADVSIVAANYNNAAYLPDFINSVLGSSVLPRELIIVDDGSTDDSVETLSQHEEIELLRIIAFDSNQGFGEALNAGVDASVSKYIMRVDPDDVLMKSRLEKQFLFLEDNPSIDVVGCNVVYFDSQSGKALNISNFPREHAQISKAYHEGEHGVQHATTMLRAEVLKKHRYNQKHVPAEDYDLFARVIKDGSQFANISEALSKVRIHPESASSNLQLSTIEKTFKLRDEIFDVETSKAKIYRYYWHILNYRKYLMSQNRLRRLLYLFLAALFYPSKLLRRILREHKQ
jgi:glycosyltransferase involved in cell wall biosynthesis